MNKKTVWTSIVLITIVGIGIYVMYKNSNHIIRTQPIQTQSVTCSDATSTPVITSLSTYSASVGSKITITGCNLSGFEGDKNVWIENNHSLKGILYGERDSDPKNIRIVVPARVCQHDTSYSGLPCDAWLTLTPGTYTIYATPWGTTSNTVKLLIK